MELSEIKRGQVFYEDEYGGTDRYVATEDARQVVDGYELKAIDDLGVLISFFSANDHSAYAPDLYTMDVVEDYRQPVYMYSDTHAFCCRLLEENTSVLVIGCGKSEASAFKNRQKGQGEYVKSPDGSRAVILPSDNIELPNDLVYLVCDHLEIPRPDLTEKVSK